eukprot:jgi/Chlat1/6846/Chrsp51S06533
MAAVALQLRAAPAAAPVVGCYRQAAAASGALRARCLLRPDGSSRCQLTSSVSSRRDELLSLRRRLPGRERPAGSRYAPAQASSAAAAPTADDVPAPSAASAPAWTGAKPLPMLLSVGVGLIVRYLVPKPAAITTQAWQLLAIFLSTIAGLVLGPLPVGAWAFIGLTTTVMTKTLSFVAAFGAFTNDVIWLIVISFFFARGFVKTGLGDRVATLFVKWMGASTLGLSYGLAISEAIIAPAMPSTTARAGGVFLPIINSLSRSSGSKPNDPSARKLGAFLVQAQLQGCANSSALFLTAAAQNLLCLKLATELGVVIPSPWMTWFKAAALPAIAALLAGPFIMFKLYPPEIQNTPEAPGIAAEKLKKMGPMTRDEKVMVATMLLAVTLWVAGEALKVSSVSAAMLGLSILLLSGVLQWSDCLNESAAWDTLAWFAVLVGMSGQLNSLGVVKFLSDTVAGALASMNLAWPAALTVLSGVYFGVHYLFASQTAHVGALFGAFLAMAIAAGAPPLLATLVLAYLTNLFGALTHYSSGQAAVYYGAGFNQLPDVFRLGITCALVNLGIWAAVGIPYWKFLGLY